MQVQDYKKLYLIFDIFPKLGKSKLSELEYAYTSLFLYSLNSLQPHFKDLNKQQMKLVSENVSIQVFERGEIIFREHDKTKNVYLVILGNVMKCERLAEPQVESLLGGASLIPIRDRLNEITTRSSDKIVRKQGVNYFKSTADLSDTFALSIRNMLDTQLHMILHHEVDKTLSFVQECLPYKTQEYCQGEIIGDFLNQEDKSRQEFTAICKTDCVLLNINKHTFKLLQHQKN